uniref:Germin-like protein n=1 Tax=Kalanchoe fedtschenkoi TaxID=63787 RepID=A0A7N0V0X3_KALFE
MASFFKQVALFLVVALFATAAVVHADPDILTDFVLPLGSVGGVNGTFFSYSGFRGVFSGPAPPTFKATKAFLTEFPALNGQSVGMAVLQFPVGTVNPPHTHPRSAELLFLVEGSLQVGFVDTTNKLYTQSLQLGDAFIFPKGLVHFQYNADANVPAVAISAFGSAAAGTVSVPGTIFNTTIDDTILAKSFKTDVATIQKLKAGLA